jgi:hypothetical protein
MKNCRNGEGNRETVGVENWSTKFHFRWTHRILSRKWNDGSERSLFIWCGFRTATNEDEQKKMKGERCIWTNRMYASHSKRFLSESGPAAMPCIGCWDSSGWISGSPKKNERCHNVIKKTSTFFQKALRRNGHRGNGELIARKYEVRVLLFWN